MSIELLGRIQQELSITGSAIYETVLALAERANRKVQVLRLHSQASSLLSQIEQGHGDLGRQIAALCAKRPPFSHESTPQPNQLESVLGQAGDQIQFDAEAFGQRRCDCASEQRQSHERRTSIADS